MGRGPTPIRHRRVAQTALLRVIPHQKGGMHNVAETHTINRPDSHINSLIHTTAMKHKLQN